MREILCSTFNSKLFTFHEFSRYHKVGNVTGLRDLHRLEGIIRNYHTSYLMCELTPRMATSMCPPRIIANDSLESAGVLFNESTMSNPVPLLTKYGCSRYQSDSLFSCVDNVPKHKKSAHSKNSLRKGSHASSCFSVGYGPIPRIPFSLCSHTFTPGGRCSGTRVGMPIPRFTWKPFLSSFAARRAIR